MARSTESISQIIAQGDLAMLKEIYCALQSTSNVEGIGISDSLLPMQSSRPSLGLRVLTESKLRKKTWARPVK